MISLKFPLCHLPQANLLQNFICCSIMRSKVQKPKLSFISLHIYGMMVTFSGVMKKTGNFYGVSKVFKWSMILNLLLTYWGRRVRIFLSKNIIKQDTKNFRISNRPGRVFFLIIQKRLKHQSQVYKISLLMPSNSPSIVVQKVSLHQMTQIHLYS